MTLKILVVFQLCMVTWFHLLVPRAEGGSRTVVLKPTEEGRLPVLRVTSESRERTDGLGSLIRAGRSNDLKKEKRAIANGSRRFKHGKILPSLKDAESMEKAEWIGTAVRKEAQAAVEETSQQTAEAGARGRGAADVSQHVTLKIVEDQPRGIVFSVRHAGEEAARISRKTHGQEKNDGHTAGKKRRPHSSFASRFATAAQGINAGDNVTSSPAKLVSVERVTKRPNGIINVIMGPISMPVTMSPMRESVTTRGRMAAGGWKTAVHYRKHHKKCKRKKGGNHQKMEPGSTGTEGSLPKKCKIKTSTPSSGGPPPSGPHGHHCKKKTTPRPETGVTNPWPGPVTQVTHIRPEPGTGVTHVCPYPKPGVTSPRPDPEPDATSPWPELGTDVTSPWPEPGTDVTSPWPGQTNPPCDHKPKPYCPPVPCKCKKNRHLPFNRGKKRCRKHRKRPCARNRGSPLSCIRPSSRLCARNRKRFQRLRIRQRGGSHPCRRRQKLCRPKICPGGAGQYYRKYMRGCRPRRRGCGCKQQGKKHRRMIGRRIRRKQKSLDYQF